MDLWCRRKDHWQSEKFITRLEHQGVLWFLLPKIPHPTWGHEIQPGPTCGPKIHHEMRETYCNEQNCPHVSDMKSRWITISCKRSTRDFALRTAIDGKNTSHITSHAMSFGHMVAVESKSHGFFQVAFLTIVRDIIWECFDRLKVKCPVPATAAAFICSAAPV